LSLISHQDFKSREVYWFLFPIAGISMSLLFLKEASWYNYGLNVGVNLGVVIILITILYAYSKIKLKVNFWQEAFGLGDALFFIVFAISFPIVSFVVLFVAGLIFSLIMSLYFSKKKESYTIPLAGYMSLFLILVFITTWVYSFNLYLI